jgi:hypothetical protein
MSTGQVRTQQTPSDVQRAQAMAFNRGGLREAATVTGSFERVVAVYRGSPVSLHQLISFSNAIVIGSTVSNHGVLIESGRSIETELVVSVEETLKGSIGRPSVTVILPGGRVGFPGGSWAQVGVRGFRRPERGRKYLFFLRQARNQMFEPAFGPVGVFDITEADALARPAGGHDTSFSAGLRSDRLSNSVFLAQVRGAVVRQ